MEVAQSISPLRPKTYDARISGATITDVPPSTGGSLTPAKNSTSIGIFIC